MIKNKDYYSRYMFMSVTFCSGNNKNVSGKYLSKKMQNTNVHTLK